MCGSDYYDFETIYLKILAKRGSAFENSDLALLYDDELKNFIVNHAALVNTFLLSIDEKDKVLYFLKSTFDAMPVYHYTSLKALDSILKSKSIYLSQFKDMNDKTEGVLFLDYFKSWLKRQLCSDKSLEQFDEFFNDFKKKVEENFSMSFSFSYDDNAQWERYANEGRGVCLASSLNKIESAVKMLKGASISPVVYSSPHSKVNELQIYNVIKNSFSNEEDPSLLVSKFLSYCSYMKDSSFNCEHELRLFFDGEVVEGDRRSPMLYRYNNQDNLIEKIKHLLKKAKNTKERLVINMDEVRKNAKSPSSFLGMFFDKIIVGPRASKKDFEHVKMLKNKYSLIDIEVEKSNSTLK